MGQDSPKVRQTNLQRARSLYKGLAGLLDRVGARARPPADWLEEQVISLACEGMDTGDRTLLAGSLGGEEGEGVEVGSSLGSGARAEPGHRYGQDLGVESVEVEQKEADYFLLADLGVGGYCDDPKCSDVVGA
jgi:hypothetical protein